MQGKQVGTSRASTKKMQTPPVNIVLVADQKGCRTPPSGWYTSSARFKDVVLAFRLTARLLLIWSYCQTGPCACE